MKKSCIVKRFLCFCLGGIVWAAAILCCGCGLPLVGAEDAVIYVTAQGIEIRKSNAGLYLSLNGQTYEVLGQGGGESEYKRLEYVESTNSQHFNTGFRPNNNSSIQMAFAPSRLSANQTIYCARGSSVSNLTFTAFIMTDKIRADYNNDNTMAATYTLTLNKKHTIYTNKNKTYMDGSLIKTHTVATFTAGGNIVIGKSYWGGSNWDNQAYFKYYSIVIWDNGTIVRDFVPMRNSSGVNGFYDYVGGKFYSSISEGYEAGPEMVSGGVYVDNSYAGVMIGQDQGVREIGGVRYVVGLNKGYLLCRNSATAEHLQVRI